MFEKFILATDISKDSSFLMSCAGALKPFGAKKCLLIQFRDLNEINDFAVVYSDQLLYEYEKILARQKLEIEKEGLEVLDKNKELKYYTNIENNKYNLIGPLFVEESCMQCHAEQGYKVGDLRGGLRVSVPIDTYIKNI